MSSPPLKKRRIGDPERPQHCQRSNLTPPVEAPAAATSYQIQRFLFNDPDNDSTTWAIIEGRKLEPQPVDSHNTTAEPPGSCEDDSSAAADNDPAVSFHQNRSRARLAESNSRFRATRFKLDYHESDTCKEGKQFPNISKLREHLKRVHSPEYRCQDCDHRFSQVSMKELKVLREFHQSQCHRSGRLELPNFDMSQEQWEKCKNWNKNQKVDRLQSKNGLSERKPDWSWRRIYNSLFPLERSSPDQELGNFKQLPSAETRTEIQAQAQKRTQTHTLPSKGTSGPGPGPGNVTGSLTTTAHPFMSTFSLDFKASSHQGEASDRAPSYWNPAGPQGPSSLTPSSTSGTTETAESASTLSEPAFDPVPPRIFNAGMEGHNLYIWDTSAMDFFNECTGSSFAQYGPLDERMDGSST